jgi:hypothetical protein
MQVTIDIPDTLAAQLAAAGKDPARAALETLAIDGYRTHRLTESEVRRMLHLETRFEVHTLLAAHQVPLHYTQELLQQDIAASDALAAQRTRTSAHAA